MKPHTPTVSTLLVVIFYGKYGVVSKKVFLKNEGKMPQKMKMILQRARNLVHVKQYLYGVSFCNIDNSDIDQMTSKSTQG